MFRKIVGGSILLVIAISIIGSLAGGKDKTSAQAAQSQAHGGEAVATAVIGPKVTGRVKKSFFMSGDSEADRSVRFTHYWCRWNDGQVEVHVVVKNPMAAHITVHLQPNYRLAGAGLHGDGLTSQEDIGVNAHATRYWSTKLGSPDGVDGTPRISDCGPELNGIDLG